MNLLKGASLLALAKSIYYLNHFYRFKLNLLKHKKRDIDLVKVKEVIICAVRDLYLVF